MKRLLIILWICGIFASTGLAAPANDFDDDREFDDGDDDGDDGQFAEGNNAQEFDNQENFSQNQNQAAASNQNNNNFNNYGPVQQQAGGNNFNNFNNGGFPANPQPQQNAQASSNPSFNNQEDNNRQQFAPANSDSTNSGQNNQAEADQQPEAPAAVAISIDQGDNTEQSKSASADSSTSNNNNNVLGQDIQRSAQAASISEPSQLQDIEIESIKSAPAANVEKEETIEQSKAADDAPGLANGLAFNQIENNNNADAFNSNPVSSDSQSQPLAVAAEAASASLDDLSENAVAPDSSIDIADSIALKRSPELLEKPDVVETEEKKRSLGEDADPCAEPLKVGNCEETIQRDSRTPKGKGGKSIKSLKLDLGSSATGFGSNKLRRKFPLAFCDLQRDNGIICPGIRRGNYVDQFYYDPSSNRCLQFIYNGCGGNANRFSSLWECNQSCSRKSVFKKL